MKMKSIAAAVLAASLLLTLTACGKTQDAAAIETPNVTAGQTDAQSTVTPSATPSASPQQSPADDEAWKTEFEKSLFDNYDVKPDHYEDLGGGIYQVYVEKDGKVIPFVTVDSTTGDYHG